MLHLLCYFDYIVARKVVEIKSQHCSGEGPGSDVNKKFSEEFKIFILTFLI